MDAPCLPKNNKPMKENVCIARFKAVVCLLAVCICGLSSCSSEEGDLRKPVIETLDDSFPTNCQVYVKGGVIPFHYAFTDDVELGNYNIEVHNNFDHHTHSTEAGDCPFDPVKKPVKPWGYNRDFSIPPHSLRHDARVEIPIPGDIDAGDYHFMIRVTDRAGWQELKSVSIKIVEAS